MDKILKDKIIKLNEKEQKELFCAAWHLTNFLEDAKENKIASFATPCETCKINKECLEKDNFDFYTHFQTLTKLTGVIVTPLVGSRELAKQGKFSFIKKDFEELQGKQDIDHNHL